MPLKNGESYRESLRSLNLNIYAAGEKIQNVVDHPLTRPHVNAAAMTYDLVHEPAAEDLMTATSHLTGREINRFTHIHQRFYRYLRFIKENDLIVAGSMTDPKGDRNLRPYQQADPDLYTRIVEKNKDGIVIRGSKAHQTGIVNSHEMLIMRACTAQAHPRRSG